MITFHPHNHPVIPTLKITIVKYIKLTQWINQGPTVNELQSWDSPRTIYAFLFVLKHRQKGAVLWGLLWLTGNSEVGSTVCVTDSGKVRVGHHHTVYVRILSPQSWGPLSFKHTCFGGIRLSTSQATQLSCSTHLFEPKSLISSLVVEAYERSTLLYA